MKIVISIFGLFILMTSSAFAQFQARYATPYFEIPASLDFADSDGYVVLSNYIDSTWRPIIVRSDSDGEIVWANEYTLPAFKTAGGLVDIKASSWNESLYLAAGRAVGYYGPTIGKDDMFLMMVKDSGGGAISQAKQYGTKENDWARSLTSTNHPKYGPIFGIAGVTNDLKSGLDINMMLGDSKGNLLRGFVYNVPLHQQVISVAPTADDGFIIVGESEVKSSCDSLTSNIFLMKLDLYLNPQWIRTYDILPGIDYTTTDKPTAVMQDNEGNFLISGTATFKSKLETFQRAFLIKTNKLGDRLWAKTYAVTAYPDATSFGNSVVTLEDPYKEPQYVLAGYLGKLPNSVSNAWLVNTDKNGFPSWSKTYQPSYPYFHYSMAKKLRYRKGKFAFTGRISESSYPSTQQDINLVETNFIGDSATSCQEDIVASFQHVKVCEGKLEIQSLNEMGSMDSSPGFIPIPLQKRDCEDNTSNVNSCVSTQ